MQASMKYESKMQMFFRNIKYRYMEKSIPREHLDLSFRACTNKQPSISNTNVHCSSELWSILLDIPFG